MRVLRPRPSAPGVLQLVWRERHISRAEIARRLDLSRSTVSEIVDDLLPTGLVAEVGAGPSQGGRRPIVLQFQDEAWGILGIDVGAAHVAAAVTDLRGRVLAWANRDHAVRDDPAGTLRAMRELSERCVEKWGGGAARLLGAGVAVPSPVDPRAPGELCDLILPAWRGVDLRRDLQARYGIPVLVENDANLGALAEHWWGAGRGVQDFTYVKVATGIGAGHIIGGEIYRGASGVAGEIGHLAIDPQGARCVCGLRGCLTTLVGAAALVVRARALRPRHAGTAVPGHPSLAEIEDAALAGDPLALQVVREAAGHLGVAISGLINLMNPARVIIGGGLTRLGEILLEPLRETVRSHTLVTSAAAAEIRASALGARATAVLQRALADPTLFPAAAR